MSSISRSLPAVFVLIAVLAPPARAQETGLATGPAANPADVASVDAIITAVYEAFSGSAGEERNWDRFRSLFIPEARLIAVVRREDGEVVRVSALAP